MAPNWPIYNVSAIMVAIIVAKETLKRFVPMRTKSLCFGLMLAHRGSIGQVRGVARGSDDPFEDALCFVVKGSTIRFKEYGFNCL